MNVIGPVDLIQATNALLSAGETLVGLTLKDGVLLRSLADGTTVDLTPAGQAIVQALVPPAVEQQAATDALLAQVVAAYQRLTQIQQQADTLVGQVDAGKAQMATIKTNADSVAGMTATQATSAATIKAIAAAISTLATTLSAVIDNQGGIAKAVKDEAVDIQFLARQIAAQLGVNVTGA